MDPLEYKKYITVLGTTTIISTTLLVPLSPGIAVIVLCVCILSILIEIYVNGVQTTYYLIAPTELTSLILLTFILLILTIVITLIL